MDKIIHLTLASFHTCEAGVITSYFPGLLSTVNQTVCLIFPANTWSRVQTQQMAFVMIIRSSLVSLPQNRRTSLFLCHDGCGLALSLSFVYCVTLSVQRLLTSVSTFLALVILAGTAFLGNHTSQWGQGPCIPLSCVLH